MSKFRIGLLQTDIIWGIKQANFQKILDLTASTDVDLLLLPEMFQTGFCVDEIQHAESMEGETVTFLKELALKLNAVVAGTFMYKEGDKIFNRFIAVGNEGVIAFYDKVHLFKYSNEDEFISPGNAKVDLDIAGRKFRMITCYDLRFPYISYNDSDYDVLLVSANWPSQRIKHWDALLQARAIENQAFTIGVNRVGHDSHDIFYPGHSSVYDMLGERLLRFTGEELRICEIDLEQQDELRRKLPFIVDRVI